MMTADTWPVDGGRITIEFDAEILDKWLVEFVPDNRDDYIVTIHVYAHPRRGRERGARVDRAANRGSS